MQSLKGNTQIQNVQEQSTVHELTQFSESKSNITCKHDKEKEAKNIKDKQNMLKQSEGGG